MAFEAVVICDVDTLVGRYAEALILIVSQEGQRGSERAHLE